MKIGYFSDEKREYIIENMHPVRPLKNFFFISFSVKYSYTIIPQL